jgi:hypothetical protein
MPSYSRRGELGLASEVKVARSWYGNAKELGSEEALQRLRSRVGLKPGHAFGRGFWSRDAFL